MRKTIFLKVRGAIAEAGLSHRAVAQSVGLSPAKFSQRMTGITSFKREEIQKICKVLDKPESIFFE